MASPFEVMPAELGSAERILALIDVELMVLTLDGTVVYVNERSRHLAGLKPGQEAFRDFADYWMIDPQDVGDTLRKLGSGSTWQALSLRRSNGASAGEVAALRGRGFRTSTAEGPVVHVLIVEDAGRGRQFDEHRQLIRKLNKELAHRRGMERTLTNLLATQKRLHRELMHRVKNNLTLLVSLVTVGKRRCDSELARWQFEQLEQRILSVAKIHQLLDRKHETDSVAGDRLLREIGEELARSLAPPTVTLSCDLEPLRLQISQATPLALIVNELVTNAIKHAFPDDRQGQVSLRLAAQDNGCVAVTVADDGIGACEGRPAWRGSGSGIVQALVGQLNGTLTQIPEHGTTWFLTFRPTIGNDPETD